MVREGRSGWGGVGARCVIGYPVTELLKNNLAFMRVVEKWKNLILKTVVNVFLLVFFPIVHI